MPDSPQLPGADTPTVEELRTLLTEDEARDLEAFGKPINRSAKETLFAQGEMTDFVLLITKGHVEIMSDQPTRTVAIRGPGEVVGETAALTGEPRSATVKALNGVAALWISASQFRRFLWEHPRVAMALAAALGRRVGQAQESVGADWAAERKVAKALIERTDIGLGSATEEGIALPVSQQDLADAAGVSLESVKKIIRSFKAGGVVLTRRQLTVIRDLKVLRMIANGEDTASA